MKNFDPSALISLLMSLALFFLFAADAEAYCTVSCKSNVEISAGISCEPEVHASQLLYNYQYNQCNYQVNIFNSAGVSLGNTIPQNLVGETLTYTVSSGPMTCSGQISAQDDVAPVAVCDLDTRISLGSNGTGRVYTHAFDDGSYDNCAVQSIQIARKYPGNCPYGVKDDTEFRQFVEVCCSDIDNSPLEILLKVTDEVGNSNVCWALLYVEDNLPPVINCPTDITVSCEFEIDFDDLSVFGKVALSQAEREVIVIQEPFYAPNFIAGLDGIATDNCGLSLSEDYEKDLKCGKGTVERTFTATDPDGRKASCIQEITIVELEPFDDEYIEWPDDVMIDNCPDSSYDPTITGRPEILGTHCSHILFSYRDEIFTQADGACFKVLRTWSVMDWCQHIPNVYPSVGLWTNLQVIKVKTSQGPEILNCEPVTVCGEDAVACSGKIELTQAASDDCTPDSLLKWTYMIDIGANGQYNVMGTGNEISGEYPFGKHRVRWEVKDLCGNKSHCVQEIEVEDCKAPTPVCHHGLSTVVMPVSGEVELSADLFDAGSFDNCTDEENLAIAFSQNPGDTTRVFDCTNLDTTEIEIWVIDEYGNSDFCRTYLKINDNHGACLDSLIGFTAGVVLDPNYKPLSGVEIDFNSQYLPYVENGLTTSEGYYELQWYLIPESGSGEIRAVKDDNPINGVTSLDLLLIQLHVLGLQPFTTLEQHIAADINRDGKVDVADVAEGRRLILGQQKEFLHNTSWRIFPAHHQIRQLSFEDVIPPEEFRTFFYADSMVYVDFDAVKIGDVNASAKVGSFNADERSVPVVEMIYSLDSENQLGFRFSENLRARTLQFSLDLEVPPHQIRSVEWGSGGEFHYHIKEGAVPGHSILSVSVIGLEGFYFQTGKDFLTLDFEDGNRETGLDLLDYPAIAEIGTEAPGVAGIVLKAGENEHFDVECGEISARAEPNPSAGSQTVYFSNLSEGSIYECMISDAAGRVIEKTSFRSSGRTEEINLTENDFSSPGMYFLHLRSRDSSNSIIVKIVRH
jgi:hypothetical protein